MWGSGGTPPGQRSNRYPSETVPRGIFGAPQKAFRRYALALSASRLMSSRNRTKLRV